MCGNRDDSHHSLHCALHTKLGFSKVEGLNCASSQLYVQFLPLFLLSAERATQSIHFFLFSIELIADVYVCKCIVLQTRYHSARLSVTCSTFCFCSLSDGQHGGAGSFSVSTFLLAVLTVPAGVFTISIATFLIYKLRNTTSSESAEEPVGRLADIRPSFYPDHSPSSAIHVTSPNQSPVSIVCHSSPSSTDMYRTPNKSPRYTSSPDSKLTGDPDHTGSDSHVSTFTTHSSVRGIDNPSLMLTEGSGGQGTGGSEATTSRINSLQTCVPMPRYTRYNPIEPGPPNPAQTGSSCSTFTIGSRHTAAKESGTLQREDQDLAPSRSQSLL